ncbi:unnamed protein product, partial [Mesorhabditis belari]|uniref:Uncharacterized protein n=1 Tax=Mesorhabditis belari TaxID=2138241 RepID=A0AAF3J5H3_9BILA
MEDDEEPPMEIFLRGYDPVTVAASLTLRLPFNMIHGSTNGNPYYSRRRLSLIEALNNSIQEDFDPTTTKLQALSFNNNNPADDLLTHIIPSKSSFVDDDLDEMNRSFFFGDHGNERVYSIRQILAQNPESFPDRGRLSMKLPRFYSRSKADENAYIPELIRQLDRPVKNQKRSKSQPMAPSPNESDDDYETVQHISRVQAPAEEWSRGCRCSLQSTSSSGSRSNGSTESSSDGAMIAEASFDHVALLPDELPFAAGDVISIFDASSQTGLWYGSCGESQGWFPASHVRVVSGSSSRPSSTSLSTDSFPQSMRTQRANVVEELMNTERDYVRLLENIVQGFLEQTRRRSELFSSQRVRNIFGNIQSIYLLHSKILRDLEIALDQSSPENTCLGSAFLRNKQSFAIYSDYCNNRPVSCAELAILTRQPIYHQFFEACRLLRGMPNLSLEGFLLTPVQRICRYPLQLAELLKATPDSHEDRTALEAAERAMRAVAAQINDRKRRIEALQDIALWQKNVHGWRGPDLLENNSAMLRSGEVFCRSVAPNSSQWSKDILLFLFDQSIVICKKDLIKKNFYIFKERMSLQQTNVVDVRDGKDSTFNVNVKNSFKLIGPGKQYLFSCNDKKTKAAWLAAFDKRCLSYPSATAEEKRLAIATLNNLKLA